MMRGGNRSRLPILKRVWQDPVPAKDDRPLDQVLQFTNVTGPGIPLEGSHDFRSNRLHLLSHTLAEVLHVMCHKSGNILPALS